MSKLNLTEMTVEIQLKNKGYIKALAAINYYGVRVTHIRIMENRRTGSLFVTPPAIYGKMKCFWIPNEEDRIKFEDFLLAKYKAFWDKVESGEEPDNTPDEEV